MSPQLVVLHVLWISGITYLVGISLRKYHNEAEATLYLKALTWPLWMLWYGLRAISDAIFFIRAKMRDKINNSLL